MIKDRIILGIDPGTIVMGYGILKIEGNKPMLEAMGILQLNKYEDHYLRLRKIFERVLALIDQYHPDELAIEAPFFGKNVQSMLKLGRAQGVAMAAAVCHYFQTNNPVSEKKYTGWKDFIAKNPGKVR